MPRFVCAILSAVLLASTSYAAPIGYSVQSNGNQHLYQIDLATGVATDLGLVSFSDAEGLAMRGGQLLAIGGTNGQLWNLSTPPGVLIGNTGPRNGIDAGLDFNSAGALYNINGAGTGSSLYSINPLTGAATLVGNGAFFADGMAINSAGVAYATDFILTDSLYTVNLATGAMSVVGGATLGDISLQTGLAFDANDVLYAITSGGQIYTVNTTTGAATFVANVTIGGVAASGFEGLAIDRAATEVPEPASLTAFLAVCIAGTVCGYRRRRVEL